MSRPTEMARDTAICVDCGMCEEIASGVDWNADGVEVMPLSLDAMAACPVGAIKWIGDVSLGRRRPAGE